MSKCCDLLIDKKVMVGNNVSHSKRKTRRRFLPNLQSVSFYSDTLGKKFSLRIASRTLRTVDFKGGFDSFLLNTSSNKLTEDAKKIKRAIKKKIAAAA